MAPSPLHLDPFEMWRQALSRLESSANSLAHGGLNSDEFARALHQFSGVSRSMQQSFEKALGSGYRRLNVASRQDMNDLAETLQRVEAKLDQLLTADASPPRGPRPARTRRPPGHTVALTDHHGDEAAPAAVARPTRRRT